MAVIAAVMSLAFALKLSFNLLLAAACVKLHTSLMHAHVINTLCMPRNKGVHASTLSYADVTTTTPAAPEASEALPAAPSAGSSNMELSCASTAVGFAAPAQLLAAATF